VERGVRLLVLRGAAVTPPQHGPEPVPAVPGRGRWPAADDTHADAHLAAGWLAWAGPEGREEDTDLHGHLYSEGRFRVTHRHDGGAAPHDHEPPGRRQYAEDR
jgi:hypothetical protein